jgi:uncharacterized protein YdhG (YjbR/CyaY superfamily)
MADTYATVDEYIVSCPDEVQGVLREIRRTILSAVPAASEKISYQIPTMTFNGRNLVHFGAWKNHVAVYPLPADDILRAELAPYLTGKATVRFPLTAPIPYDLIGRLAAQLATERG